MSSKKLILSQMRTLKENRIPQLGPLIDKYLVDIQTPNNPDGFIHPSRLGGCPRYMFFWLKKEPFTEWQPHDARLQKIFDNGFAVEISMFKKYFDKMGLMVGQEVNLPSNPYRVKGRCDVILWWQNDYWVVDIKTANSFSFENNIPNHNYHLQLATYMRFLGIPKGKIFYYNKNTSETAESFVSSQDSVYDEAFRLIQMHNLIMTTIFYLM